MDPALRIWDDGSYRKMMRLCRRWASRWGDSGMVEMWPSLADCDAHRKAIGLSEIDDNRSSQET